MTLELVAAAGWVVGGLAVGLWLGERGRRKAAEQRETTGSPLGPIAARLPDAPDAEERVMAAGRAAATGQISEATIRRGTEQIMQEAAAIGRPISEKEAREQAVMMLTGAIEFEPDLPEFGG